MRSWETAGRRSSPRTGAIILGIAVLAWAVWPPTTRAASIVPLTGNCYFEATAPGGAYDAGWNYARAMGMYQGIPFVGQGSCTNLADGSAQLWDYADTDVMCSDARAWSTSAENTLQIGTAPGIPAGTPLTLSVHFAWQADPLPCFDNYFRLYRGTQLVCDSIMMLSDETCTVYAGETVRPSLLWRPPHSPGGGVYVCLSATPEPATAALAAMGLLIATARRRLRR